MKSLIAKGVKVEAIICWSNVADTKCLLDEKFIMQNWIVWDRIKGRGSKKNFVSTREDILWYCKGKTPTYQKIYSNIPKKTGGMGRKNGQECRALTNVWYDISPIVPWSPERNGASDAKTIATYGTKLSFHYPLINYNIAV